MKVTLVDHPRFSDYKAYCAARVCYSDKGFVDIWCETPMSGMDAEDVDNDKALQLLRGLVRKGHGSILEHCCFTFAIEGISRACSHQLVRHRIASYSQQSQRYVDANKCTSYVIPPEIEKDENLKTAYGKYIHNAIDMYNALVDNGVKKEDARYILPNAMATNIVVTMNARELLHFIELRTSPRAQWEIRELAEEMLRQLKEVSPVIFGEVKAKD